MDVAKRLLAICAVGVAIVIVILVRTPSKQSPLVGQEAPAFEALNPNGILVSLEDFSLGSAIMAFWRLHDPEDVKIVSELNRLRKDPQLLQVAVVAVNCDATGKEIREFVEGKDLGVIILHMGDDRERLRKIDKLYQLSARKLPRIILIQFRNRVVCDLEGLHSAEQIKQKALELGLAPAVAEQQSAT